MFARASVSIRIVLILAAQFGMVEVSHPCKVTLPFQVEVHEYLDEDYHSDELYTLLKGSFSRKS